jgi:hypothetical protein
MPGIFDLLTPLDTRDTYAISDPLYQKGGWREVSTILERDAIPEERRRLGMFVYVIETDKLYILTNGILNTNWIIYDPVTTNFPSTINLQELNLNPSKNINTIGILNDISINGYSVLKLNGATQITGFYANINDDGKLLYIQNHSNSNILIKNDSNSSLEGNRIYTGSNNDINLPPNNTFCFQYITEKLHWNIIGSAGNNVNYRLEFNNVNELILDHNFGYYPLVMLYDTSGIEAVAQIQFPSLNTTVLTFNKNESGYVILR